MDEFELYRWATATGMDEATARAKWALRYNGKMPGAVSAWGRWYPLNAQKADLTGQHGADMARAWRRGAGTGVLGRYWPCLDVDVLDAAKAEATRVFLEGAFGGHVWARIGRAPKFAVPFRWAPGWAGVKKVVLELGGQPAQRVEVIGAGFQWVLDGVHGGTGEPYRWEGPGGRQERPRASQLPMVTRGGLELLLEHLRGVLGTQRRAKGKWNAGPGLEPGRDAQEGLEAHAKGLELRGPEAMVRTLVATIPNDAAQGVEYEAYVTMLHALKGASGGEDWGLGIWLDWCAQWPWNRPETNLDKWAGLAAGSVRIGMDWLIRQARISPGDQARTLIDLVNWREDQQQQQQGGEDKA